MTAPLENTVTGTGGGSANYLSFRLAGEIYALEILRVREVLDYAPVMPVPRMPDYLLGVIDLRGSVLPVVDLRRQLGLPPALRTVNTCIIVVEALAEGELTVLGLLADAVEEVFELSREGVAPAPPMGTGLDTSFITGVGRLHDRMLIILNIDRVFPHAQPDAAVRAA